MNKRERRINLLMRFVVSIVGALVALSLTWLGTFALQIGFCMAFTLVVWDSWSAWWRHRCRIRELDERAAQWTTKDTKIYVEGIVRRNVN